MKRIDYIIEKTISRLIEQDPAAPAAGGDSKPKETDNAPSSADISPFTPAEEKFLGKFDAYGTTHLGIIYSPSDIGIREFIGRSGSTLNCTPEILLKLLRNKIIKIVPYTGYGRNTDYTIELQLSLDDVKGLGAADKEKAEAGSSASGAPAGGGAPPPPGPENAGYIPKGNLISESVKQRLLTEEFNNFVNLLAEANDENIISESAQKEYLIQKSKLSNVEKGLENAFDFWSNVLSSIKSGWGANWDETKFLNAFNKYLFYSGVKATDQAKYIDAIGKIVELAKTGDLKIKLAAGDFLDDWSLGWESNLIFFENSDGFGSKPWNLQWLLSNDVLDYIINSNESDVVFVATPGQKTAKAKTKPASIAFTEKLYSRGIGTLVIPEKGWGASRTKASGGKNFYPAYSNADVNNLVNKLLVPYKVGTKKDPTSGMQVIDTEKLKKQTFRDTLSKDQIVQRAKYAKAQINKNMKKFVKGKKPPNVPLLQLDDNMPAWVDEKGYGFIYNKLKNGNVIRYYPDGKSTMISKSGKVISTTQWYIFWDRPKQAWGISPSSGEVTRGYRYWFE